MSGSVYSGLRLNNKAYNTVIITVTTRHLNTANVSCPHIVTNRARKYQLMSNKRKFLNLTNRAPLGLNQQCSLRFICSTQKAILLRPFKFPKPVLRSTSLDIHNLFMSLLNSCGGGLCPAEYRIHSRLRDLRFVSRNNIYRQPG